MAAKGSCCGLTSGTILAFTLRNKGKLQMTLGQPNSSAPLFKDLEPVFFP